MLHTVEVVGAQLNSDANGNRFAAWLRHWTQHSTVANAFLVLVLFPYLTPFRTQFDIQPWAVTFGCLYAVALLATGDLRKNADRTVLVLFVIALLAALIYSFNSDLWFGFRSLVGYISVPVVALVARRTSGSISGKIFVLIVTLWFVSAVVQLIGFPRIVESVLPRLTITSSRGATSFAPEPFYLAVMSAAFAVLNEWLYQRNVIGPRAHIATLLMSVFMAIGSGTGSGLLVVGIIVAARLAGGILSSGRLKNLALTGVVTLFALGLVLQLPEILDSVHITRSPFVENTSPSGQVTLDADRGRNLVIDFLSDPWQTIVTDGSVGERLGHPIIAALSLEKSHGLGLGLGTFNDHAKSIVASAPTWVRDMFNTKFDLSGKLMTGWGTPVFELGVVGIFWIGLVIWTLVRPIGSSAESSPATVFSVLVFLPMMLMAVSIALPVFGYVVGIHIAEHRRRTESRDSNIVPFTLEQYGHPKETTTWRENAA